MPRWACMQQPHKKRLTFGINGSCIFESKKHLFLINTIDALQAFTLVSKTNLRSTGAETHIGHVGFVDVFAGQFTMLEPRLQFGQDGVGEGTKQKQLALFHSLGICTFEAGVLAAHISKILPSEWKNQLNGKMNWRRSRE